MSSVHINPQRHVVQETPTAKLFRKLLKCPDIFTYFNLDTGQWILSYWVSKPIHLAEEMDDLGAAFELVNAQFVDMICRCWKPVDWKQKKKMLLRKEKRQLERESEKIIQEQERYDWLKKRMKDKSPLPYAFKAGLKGGDLESCEVRT